MNHETFINSAKNFINLFDSWTKQVTPAAKADHLCYKCSSSAEFETIRAIFEHESDFVYQSIISKRRIAVIKFKTPITTDLGDIFYLELSDQKPDGSQTSGFDHIEIYPTAGTVDELVSNLENKGVILEKTIRPHHTTFDIEINDTFKVRIEPEPLVEKIQRDEMG